MKDKHLPPEQNHQAPPPENQHKHEKHHRHRRGPSFGFIFVLILVLAVATIVVLWKNGLIHIGKESGDGAGNGGSSAVSGEVESTVSETSSVIEIKVENERIFIDGKEVANAKELKSRITEIGDKKSYNFVHDSAIKSTYDEVKAVLNDLERALSIKVDYNETSE